MAQIFKVPVATTGPNASKLRKLTKVDRRESAGTLALFAPGHPSMPSAAPAIPAANVLATMPNLFLSQAKLLIPAGSDANLQAQLHLSTSFADGGLKGKVEYSGKKGIHGIVSKANPMAANDGARLEFHTNLKAYFYANKGNQFYTSLWSRVTRAAGTTYTTSLFDFGAGSTSQDYGHFVHSSTGTGAWNVNTAQGTSGTTYNTTGGANRRYNVGSGKAAMVATSLSTIQANWGSTGLSYNNAVVANNGAILPSWIFYEFFVEDLTVSGRTWQEVEAIDKAEFDKAFAVGGRYYGDTFTDPATLA